MAISKLMLLSVPLVALTACESGNGLRAYSGPGDYIAVAGDLGRDSGSGINDNAGIAVTPDGCQAWLIDDGVDGRASNRLDPVSGLPVCGGTPGVVYGAYQSGTPGLADRVPGEPVPVRTEMVPVRSTQGYGLPVHSVETAH